MPFVTCLQQGREMEAVVLRREGFLAYCCPKQGQDFKPLAAPLHPNMGQEPPQGSGVTFGLARSYVITVYCPRRPKPEEAS